MTEIVLEFLFPVFIGIYFLQGALTGRLGGGGRGGRRPEDGLRLPGWARLVCLALAGGFGSLSLFLLLRHFNYRL
jgi:hypothetical protein